MNGLTGLRGLALAVLLVAGVSGMSAAQSTDFLGRGADVNGKNITEQDLADFAATGANLVRLQFNVMAPLQNLEPPFGLNEDNFALVERDLDWCKKYKLNCIVSPDTLAGFESHRSAEDPMWRDPQYGEALVNFWTTIAQRLAKRGPEVAGYDLVNEPMIPAGAKKGSPGDWNALVSRLVTGIRSKDTSHAIIIQAPNIASMGRVETDSSAAFKGYFAAPPDSNVIYSVHFYKPYPFTFGKGGGGYPGTFGRQSWDAREIANSLKPVAEFQEKYHVPILLGEFSCVRWQGEAGNRWLKDVIDYAESHHWSWAYHLWRGHEMWDPERSNSNEGDREKKPSTPRLELLKSYWKQGAQ